MPQAHRTHWASAYTVPLVAMWLSACSGAVSPSRASTWSPPPSPAPAGPGETADDGAIEGSFDVGGHSLYLECTGTGSLTILYFHGVIEDPATMPAANVEDIRSGIDDEYRFCAYDRRNVGRSDTVDAPQSPEDMLRDIESLLDQAGVSGPYVLLGASFGGLPAYLFANRHPDDVVGMVLLDAMFPDDLTLDPLWPEDERYVALDEEDECCTLERISHHKVLVASSEYIGQEPDLPLIYLASEDEGLTVDGPPEYTDVAPEVLQGYVDRFGPGTLMTVSSPHFMEVAILDRIVDELRKVIELTD
jgi:pimeloyl-ACP methyl ester carboxylesterase